MALPVPIDIQEIPGEGVVARVDGHSVVVGGTDFVTRRIGATRMQDQGSEAGSVLVAIAVDGRLDLRLNPNEVTHRP
jgi:cation transport ATPase